jgi:hypothetical protein
VPGGLKNHIHALELIKLRRTVFHSAEIDIEEHRQAQA